MKTFYITTPIYYVNDKPHIGHAYTSVVCDVIARFMRLDGYQVKFLTGTDEHGQKVEKSARDAKIQPHDFVDQVSQNFRDLSATLNLSNNDFIRTTQSRHIKAAQHIWKTLQDQNQIYLGKYSGWYATRDEAFYAESEIENGLAPTGAPVEWVEEPSYFFRLSDWQEPLLAFYEENPNFIAPQSRRNEVISFVKRGLRDLSISRTTFSWGIPVPGDPTHIMYVWFDALTNYLSAIQYPDVDSDMFSFWPAELHIVGKDILRFHAVYWPAMLMAAGLRPPQKIFAHGFWTHNGQKMSKSLGNGVDPVGLVDQYGIDQVRYFLTRGVVFGSDGDYSKDALVSCINTYLANELGNLSQRVLAMIAKNCEGKIPEYEAFTEEDEVLLDKALHLIETLRVTIARTQELHRYVEALWDLIGDANRYIDYQAPWALKKVDPGRMCTVLYVLAEVLRYVGILAQPLIPSAAEKLLNFLAVPPHKRTFENLSVLDALRPGFILPKPYPIFPRILEDKNEQLAEKAKGAAS